MRVNGDDPAYRLALSATALTAILGGMVMAAVSIVLESVLKLDDSPKRAGAEVIVHSDKRAD